MEFNYYPGCTLKNKAVDLDYYARQSAKLLGVDVKEIPEWQCCGGVYPLGKDETALKLSSVRALNYAKENGGKLLTLCSACHHVLKRVNYDVINDKNVNGKVNAYLELDKKYDGSAKVVHYLEMLRDYVGFDKIKDLVKNPCGKKIACYYGCLLLRPSNIMGLDDAERPTVMEDLVKSLGGQPIRYPMSNECCGAYVGIKNPELLKKKSSLVVESAIKNGAEVIITACPLCLYNLSSVNPKVEIKYFTEVLAQALGVEKI